jgi:hypothetical protein
VKYIQCDLRKTISFKYDSHVAHKTAWLPEKYAKVGTCVKFKRSDGSWDMGWRVNETYTAVALDERIIEERSQDYKKQRKASDV